MFNRQNSLRNFYQVLQILKEIGNKEIRLAYVAGVALACSALLALLFEMAVSERINAMPAEASVHFSCKEIVLENRFPEAVETYAKPLNENVLPVSSGPEGNSQAKAVWYFDEIHQDWRCRRE